MLFRMARLKPCSALASASSPFRLTTMFPPSTFAVVRRGNSNCSLPFGPSMEIFWPCTLTFTADGIVTGCFPILDISKSSPDVTQQFAAEILLAGLNAGHQAFGRGHDRRAQTAAHTRDVVGRYITAQAGPADAAQAFDHAFAAFVLQPQLQLLDVRAFHAQVIDVTFALQDARDAFLHLRMRQLDRGNLRALRVANPREHVGNGICRNHKFTSSPSLRPGSNRSRPFRGTASGTRRT